MKFRMLCFGVINSVLFNFLCKGDDQKTCHKMQKTEKRSKRFKRVCDQGRELPLVIFLSLRRVTSRESESAIVINSIIISTT